MKKPIKEYAIVQNRKVESAKGQKGFLKKQPDDIQGEYFNIATTKAMKEFVQKYCKFNKISMTDLFLGSLENYTGFNGKNQEDILNSIKK